MYYGDLGKRTLAYFIDMFMLGAIGFLFGFILSFIGLGLIAVIVSPVISWLYFILMEGGEWHATLGKKVMGLYVADSDGNGISYSTATLSMIGKILSGLILGIGYIMGFFNEQKQCLHDMIAKTYVLNGSPEPVFKNSNSAGYAGANVNAYANEYANVPELVAVNGPLAGMIYQVGESGVIIGRDSVSCQVVIPSSQANVSRVHCYITYNPMSGMFVLNDRNSTYGTFLSNGIKVEYSQPVALKRGDRFYIASPDNTFEVR